MTGQLPKTVRKKSLTISFFFIYPFLCCLHQGKTLLFFLLVRLYTMLCVYILKKKEEKRRRREGAYISIFKLFFCVVDSRELYSPFF
jgi:hypothetical protein